MKKVLITAGGTKIMLDNARFISNISSGKTGDQIAEEFTNDFDVTLLSSASKHSWAKPFQTYEELSELLSSELAHTSFDAIIHLAAVSDYTLDKLVINNIVQTNKPTKIPSNQEVVIHLKPTAKLINSIRTWSVNKNIKIIGFKLTSYASEAEILDKVKTLQKDSDANFIVHNDLANIAEQKHSYQIYQNNKRFIKGETKAELADHLKNIVRGTL